MTSFVLKFIAIITMLIDHIGITWMKHTNLLNVIGRIAFPIFAFQISEGYTHTKNIKKYFLRLILFAVVSQVPFALFSSIFTTNSSLNVFFTLSLGLLSILLYDKTINSKFDFCKNIKINQVIKQFIGIFIAIILGVISQTLNFDYGFFGIAIIFMFYLFKNNKAAMVISFITACIIKYGISIITYGYHYLYVLLCLFTILPIIFICLYNGKQGKKVKYLIYLFYPVHLLILYFIFA